MSRDSICLWIPALVLGSTLAAAVPAGATVRSATYTWTPATGPVVGYLLYTSVDGGRETLYSYFDHPSAVIEIESGAAVIVSVAAFDQTGRTGPRSDASAPLRLCPGDFNGDERIDVSDLNNARSCVLQAGTGDCAGADSNGDGFVTHSDYNALEFGADACADFDAPGGCAGDMNGDALISTGDVLAVRHCLFQQAQGSCVYADLDGDGLVNSRDVILVSHEVGTYACSD